jgi:endonuclease/exonuclease/phosphatase (EEP) superfamily protein YafD
MLRIAAFAVGAFVVSVTALSLLRSKQWWIRAWDFPRLQVAVLGAAALGATWFAAPPLPPVARSLFQAVLAVAVAYHALLVWRYSPLAPAEVQDSRAGDPGSQLSIVICNVLQTNRDADRLLGVLREADADVVLCVETDDWWRKRLDTLKATHPHALQSPLSNLYGMVLYSRLPLHDTSIDFLIQPDIPSMQGKVRLRGGRLVWLNCVHPRPPAPGESDESLERDAELLLVGKRVSDAGLPVIVCGDLNDVAWSRTTRLFQKMSRLVDPRKGRGLFSTFHARVPGFRFPLDHIFHSNSFRLVSMRRLPYVGSDHFPVYAMLSLESSAAREQEAPPADHADEREAHGTIADGQREAARKARI